MFDNTATPPKMNDYLTLSFLKSEKDRTFYNHKDKFGNFGLAYPLNPSKKANDKHFKITPLYFYLKSPKWAPKIIDTDPLPYGKITAEEQLLKQELTLYQSTSVDVSISLNAPDNQILLQIKKIIQIAREDIRQRKKKLRTQFKNQKNILLDQPKTKEIHKNFSVWKDSIIAYDLRYKKKYEPEDICIIIKGKETYYKYKESTSRKIGRDLERAANLINRKEYLKYLP